MLKFADNAPKSYLALPKNIVRNNDFSLALDDIMQYAATCGIERDGRMSETEYAAHLLDKYADTEHGSHYLSSIRDIAFRLGSDFSSAFDILLNHIAPAADKLIKDVDKKASVMMDKTLGYTGKNGAYRKTAPKIYLLDIDHLYKSYQTTAEGFAKSLCSKYSYNVEYLNDANVTGLVNRISPVSRLFLSDSSLQAIFEDVIIKISSDEDSEVVINTNDQDAVTVEGATPNVIKEDDQSSSTADDSEVTASDDEEVTTEENDNLDETVVDEPSGDVKETENDEDAGSDANVTVKTDNDNANITVTINDEKVTTTQEDAELAMDIVKACFDPAHFDQLRKKLFADKGYVKHTNLLNLLKFIKNDIRELVGDSAEEHLPPLEMEMLLSNLEQMRELQMAGIIYLDINSVQFADTLIIGPNLLNKNLVNRALSDGIDIIPLVRNYLRVYHNTNKDDILYSYVQHQDIGQGILYSTILSSTFDVNQKLVDAKEATKNEYASRMKSNRIKAFHSSMSQYVRSLANNSTEAQLNVNNNDKAAFIRYCDERIKQFCEILSSDENANMEDMFYELVIGRWYGGTLVAKVYEYLTESIRSRASKDKLTEESIAMAKAEVVARLGSEYIFKTFIKGE